MPVPPPIPDPIQNVVYHNNGGGADPSLSFKRLLVSLRNHVAAVGREHLDIRVVCHGAGVDLLSLAATDADLAQRLDSLRADGVRFPICANTLRERQIGLETLRGATQDDVVPSGVAELARLQGMGFAYIHL
jgi:uncharacterized protein